MERVNTILYILFLFLIVCIGVYNWFYSLRVKNTEQELGLTLPSFVKNMLSANNTLSFLAAILIALFILRSFIHL